VAAQPLSNVYCRELTWSIAIHVPQVSLASFVLSINKEVPMIVVELSVGRVR
jgi:hypothetical protein